MRFVSIGLRDLRPCRPMANMSHRRRRVSACPKRCDPYATARHMSIFVFTRSLSRAALPAAAMAVGATTVRAQALRLDAAPNVAEQTVFVPPGPVVRIKDRAVFVKGDSRSLTIFVVSPTAFSDTARLAIEAKAVI